MVAATSRAISLIAILLVTRFANSQVAVTTYHNDNTRTGQNLKETILTHTNVNSNTFGRLGFLTTDGLVDGEPLYVPNVTIGGRVHNVVYVVTEHDSVYAFDADSFTQLWAVNVAAADETPSDDRGCSQVTPEIGITSTPVIDPNAGPNGTLYLVAMSKDSVGDYHQRLHALDLASGGEQSNGPTEIRATYPNSTGQLTFDSGQYKERAALLLLDGVIYMSFASHCDHDPYNGWIMGYSQTTLQQVSVFNMTPNGSQGAIWMAEGGLAADQSGNIYFLDGNGTFDTTLDANGFPKNGNFGNAFMKLSTARSSLTAADYFAMSNVASENAGDVDLGSGAPILLPDLTDNAGNVLHLAVGAGKDRTIYVVNRDNMGKFNANGDRIYQEIVPTSGVPKEIFSTPAYFNNTVYYAAVTDHLRAFTIANARLVPPAASQTTTTFGYPGATPAISANGTSDAIVWAVENGIPGVLHAYVATDLSHELYNSSQAPNGRDQFQNSKFNTPMIANGKVFINGTTGVTAFGLLKGGNTPPFGYLEQAVNAYNGGTVVGQNSPLYLSGWACDKEDGSPVAKIQVLIDGRVAGTAITGGSRPDLGGNCAVGGWTFYYNIGNLAAGPHTVTAEAFDSTGLPTTLLSYRGAGPIVVDIPPYGYLEQAVNGNNGSTILGQTSPMYISGWACDVEDGSPVAKVQVLIDGAVVGNATLGDSRPDLGAPCGLSGWTFYYVGNLRVGTHSVSALAYDSAGVSTTLTNYQSSGTISVENQPNGFLEVAVNANDGSTVLPQNSYLYVSGWACDKEDGSPVSKVQVYVDQVVVGQASLGESRPDLPGNCGLGGWMFYYNIGTLPVGTHTIGAVAFDSQNVSAPLKDRSSAGSFTVQ